MFENWKKKAWDQYREIARPWEKAATEVVTEIATDVSAKTSRKAAEKTVEETLDMMYSVPSKMADRSRRMLEEVSAFSMYVAKGGYKTEFKLAQQRVSKRADEIAEERQTKLKTSTQNGPK